MSQSKTDLAEALHARIVKGGAPKYHEAAAKTGKMFVRDRLAALLDPHSFTEDGAFANHVDETLPADGVVTGSGRIGGRPVYVMANDSTVKAGSWGMRTVEKIIRVQEQAQKHRLPLFYLVDSAGARITDQVEMFPGRRGAGKIFYNQVRLSGYVPQICLLFGPSAAGGAYIPAFCDIVIMVDGNASMYLGSPRMTEMVIGEKITLEDLGGAKMHTGVSGCADILCKTEAEAIEAAKTYFSYFPAHFEEMPPEFDGTSEGGDGTPLDGIIPANQNQPFDMMKVIERIADRDSFFALKARFAKEVITGLARIEGRVVGIIANQPKHLGGVLFVDSADKAARFIWLCDAFNIPLLFLADVPGFMIGSKVERQGIIRHGAKMISAVSEANVPKISVIVRKAYGAGLYAMCGPGFEPDCCLALPQAMIAVMGPEAAVNAVYFNKIQEKPEAERAAYVAELRAEYEKDVDLFKLASELVIDDVVPAAKLREELVRRFAAYAEKPFTPWPKKRAVTPV